MDRKTDHNRLQRFQTFTGCRIGMRQATLL